MVYLGVGEDGRLVAVKVMRPELADNPEFRATIWTSADGTSWTKAPASGTYYQLSALAPSGPAVTAIGSAANPQSQQPVPVTLPIR